jgi:hypothetical protein
VVKSHFDTLVCAQMCDVQGFKACHVPFHSPSAACTPPLHRSSSLRHVADRWGATARGGLRVQGQACVWHVDDGQGQVRTRRRRMSSTLDKHHPTQSSSGLRN